MEWLSSDRARLLVVRLDNVGDVVMLGPALRALRRALPEAHLTLLVAPAGARVAPLLPWVDDVVVERAVWQDASHELPLDPDRELRLVDRLRAGRFDAALIFTSFSQSPWPAAYACYLAGIPVRAGESKEFGGSLLTHQAAPLDDAAHQVDRNLHLLEHLGVPPAGRELELHLSTADERTATELLASVGVAPGERYAVLAPGASCAARRYPIERAAALPDLLRDRLGMAVVVVGSEREHELLAPVTARAPSLVGATSIAALAAVVAGADVVVCNDSGPMHLADAFGRPQVVLYSGTELESQWCPRCSPARLLRRATPCAPCHRFDCPYGMACLDIAPAEVADAAAALVASPTVAG